MGLRDRNAEMKLTLERKTKKMTKDKSIKYPKRDLTKNKKIIT